MRREAASQAWPSPTRPGHRGRLAPRREGATWAEEFSRLPALEQVTKDGGSGLANGLARANAQRHQQGQPVVVTQDDHFHVLREGQRGLRISAGQLCRDLNGRVVDVRQRGNRQ